MPHSDKKMVMSYVRFGAMIVTATLVMYGLTYVNTFRADHVFFSETRAYMSLVMGACMAVIMLSFMLGMYKNKIVNIAIYSGSALLFGLAVWLVRTQTTVQDLSYMRAMIPHHSIAILTSERAEISDPRVRKLADEIIASQRREISEMKVLIEAIEAHGTQHEPGKAESPTEMLLQPEVPAAEASEAKVPDGFRAEVVMTGLTFPTSVEFDGAGRMYVAEAGYSYGDPTVKPRILRVTTEGDVRTVAEGEPLIGPVNDLLWHGGRLYVAHRGKISVLEEDGAVRDIVTGLPSEGDHQTNQMSIGPDGRIYVGQGTASNSGVVGEDNYKMGWLKKHPEFHDVPAHDVQLLGKGFESPNPLTSEGEKVRTSAFHPFGHAVQEPTVVRGQTKASGTILSVNSDGSGLEVYAWGLRNPFGVMWSPDGTLFASENGFDDRGDRPIANDMEDIYVIERDAWYGWPDYAMGLPVTDERFKPKGKSPPEFVMRTHPEVEQPWLTFPKHSAIAKIDFSRSGSFGEGHMYVAFFGHMSPMTGEAPEEHGGHRVVRIDPASKEFTTFFSKKDHGGGHGPKKAESVTAGPRRLLDVRFAPDGESLYIADFGTMVVQDKARPVPGTGVVWRVFREGSPPAGPPAGVAVPKQ